MHRIPLKLKSNVTRDITSSMAPTHLGPDVIIEITLY